MIKDRKDTLRVRTGKMITKDNCIQTILLKVSEFQKNWEEHLSYWDGNSAGLCNDVSAFSDFAVQTILKESQECLVRIFDVIEQLMIEGDDDVRNAAATCFLENVINMASADVIRYTTFVHLLGKNSRNHCLAWDKFTGVQTPGI